MRHRCKPITFLFIFCLAALLQHAAKAEPFKIFMNGYLPPMSYLEKGKHAGFGFEITQAVLTETGLDFVIIPVPWQRAYKSAEKGAGAVAGMFWTEERDKLFHYSEALFTEEIVLVTRKGAEFPFETINHLKGRLILMQNGNRPGSQFEKAIAEGLFNTITDSNPAQRLINLRNSTADAALFNPGRASLIWNARQAGLNPDDFSILPKALSRQKKHIGIARGSHFEKHLVILNATIRRLHGDGTIERIMRKYTLQ